VAEDMVIDFSAIERGERGEEVVMGSDIAIKSDKIGGDIMTIEFSAKINTLKCDVDALFTLFKTKSPASFIIY